MEIRTSAPLTPETKPQSAELEAGPAKVEEPSVSDGKDGKQKGVIRNLLNGHFKAAAEESIAEYSSETGGKLQPLADGIRKAFDEFSRQLQTYLSELGSEPVEAIAAEVDVKEASAAEGFLADLGNLLDAGLESLATLSADFSILPELSEPRGNGVAYAKFLAIYEAMQGDVNEAPESKPELISTTPSLDLRV